MAEFSLVVERKDRVLERPLLLRNGRVTVLRDENIILRVVDGQTRGRVSVSKKLALFKVKNKINELTYYFKKC
jgi:hypothetical protein